MQLLWACSTGSSFCTTCCPAQSGSAAGAAAVADVFSVGKLLGTCTRSYLANQQVQHASGVGRMNMLQRAVHAWQIVRLCSRLVQTLSTTPIKSLCS